MGLDLRMLLDQLRGDGVLSVIEREVDPRFEMARVINTLGEAPVLFEKVRGSTFPVLAGLCSSRGGVARGLGVRVDDLVPRLMAALRGPTVPPCAESAACQEVVEPEVRLSRLPITTHFPQDGGPYVTAGVAVIEDPDLGRNICYHRLQLLDDRRFAVRVVEGRGTHIAWSKSGGDLPMAVNRGPLAGTVVGEYEGASIHFFAGTWRKRF